MTPIQYAFLRSGWIQVGGEDIPVFFQYDPTNEKYPFHVIFTIDGHAYYQLYNEWITKDLLTPDRLDIEPLIASAFEHLRCTPDMFHIGVMQWLSDFYYHHSRVDHANYQKHMRESDNYRYIYQYLSKQKKPDLVLKEKEILEPELS